MGELLRPILMDEEQFEKERNRLCGLNEHNELINSNKPFHDIDKFILKSANLAISQTNRLNFKK